MRLASKPKAAITITIAIATVVVVAMDFSVEAAAITAEVVSEC